MCNIFYTYIYIKKKCVMYTRKCGGETPTLTLRYSRYLGQCKGHKSTFGKAPTCRLINNTHTRLHII